MRSPRETELIEAILAADEDDDEPRLVYADYLQDRGDPRGELIAIQCGDARTPKTDALEDRALHLLDDGEARWLGAWRGELEAWRFRRGFLHHLRAGLDTFVTIGSLLFETDPYPDELVHLRSLDLTDPRAHSSDAFAGELGEILARLRLAALTLALTPTERLLRALRLPALSSLRVTRAPIDDGFTTWLPLDRLHTLDLDRLSHAQGMALAADPRYAQIRNVLLWPASIESAIALVHGALTSLELYGYAIDETFLDALANARPPLVNLALRAARISNIARLGTLDTLERLDLRSTRINDTAIGALLALPRLTTLNIAHTAITAAGMTRLYHEAPPALRELTIANPQLPDEVTRQLSERFLLHRWH